MAERDLLRVTLVAASKLGDGVFWYLLMVALFVTKGASALPAIAHLIGGGIACTALYKLIKARTSRARPCHADRGIVLMTPPLDRYSFPSGHTLHAVAFSLVAAAYYPGLLWVVAPFTLLVALSRVVLGLHYPTDVIAGAILGVLIAKVTLAF